MALTNAYATIEELRERLSIVDADDDGILERNLKAASRRIDTRCGRHFWKDGDGAGDAAQPAVRLFKGEWADKLRIDDLVSLTTLKTDEDGDGTFERTWASTDYRLEPLNGRLGGRAWPYTEICITPNGLYTFPATDTYPVAQVTGVFGWSAVPDEIVEACLLIAARLHKRKDTPFSVTGSADMGMTRLPRFDSDVEELLHDFIKEEVGAIG